MPAVEAGAMIVARGDRTCDLLALDAEDFRRIVADFPQAEADLLRIAASRRP